MGKNGTATPGLPTYLQTILQKGASHKKKILYISKHFFIDWIAFINIAGCTVQSVHL